MHCIVVIAFGLLMASHTNGQAPNYLNKIEVKLPVLNSDYPAIIRVVPNTFLVIHSLLIDQMGNFTQLNPSTCVGPPLEGVPHILIVTGLPMVGTEITMSHAGKYALEGTNGTSCNDVDHFILEVDDMEEAVTLSSAALHIAFSGDVVLIAGGQRLFEVNMDCSAVHEDRLPSPGSANNSYPLYLQAYGVNVPKSYYFINGTEPPGENCNEVDVYQIDVFQHDMLLMMDPDESVDTYLTLVYQFGNENSCSITVPGIVHVVGDVPDVTIQTGNNNVVVIEGQDIYYYQSEKHLYLREIFGNETCESEPINTTQVIDMGDIILGLDVGQHYFVSIDDYIGECVLHLVPRGIYVKPADLTVPFTAASSTSIKQGQTIKITASNWTQYIRRVNNLCEDLPDNESGPFMGDAFFKADSTTPTIYFVEDDVDVADCSERKMTVIVESADKMYQQNNDTMVTQTLKPGQGLLYSYTASDIVVQVNNSAFPCEPVADGLVLNASPAYIQPNTNGTFYYAEIEHCDKALVVVVSTSDNNGGDNNENDGSTTATLTTLSPVATLSGRATVSGVGALYASPLLSLVASSVVAMIALF